MSITLKAARINKGLNQEQASKLLGISKCTLGHYERGKTNPNAKMIKKIEELYDIKYSNIIFF